MLNQPDSPARELQVPNSLNRYKQTLTNLHESINALAARLLPVMGREPVPAPTGCEKPLSKRADTLYGQLDEQTDSLNEANGKIQKLLSLLEI